MTTTVTVEGNAILDVIRRLLQFPYPQICRHLIAVELLDQLERAGMGVGRELMDAVVGCYDADALTILPN